MKSFIEQYREAAVAHSISRSSFNELFPTFQQEFQRFKPLDFYKFTRISEEIRDITEKAGNVWLKRQPQPTSANARIKLRNAAVSRAGKSFEFLITYYLNLGFIGSNAVVTVPTKALIADCFRDCTAVTFKGQSTQTSEIDNYVIVFPDSDKAPELHKKIKLLNANELKKLITKYSEHYFTEIQLGALQLKTNWNDTAQAPTLWNIIYELSKTKKLIGTGVQVGNNGWYLHDLKQFTYSFVTRPTQDPDSFTTTGTPVARVGSLSGGNYWGCPAKPAIAKTVSDIYGIFQSAFSASPQRKLLGKEFQKLNNQTDYSYFQF